MRATLLTAQKMADSIVREAEAKRDQLLRVAQTQAQVKLNALRREAEEAQERIRTGQRELAAFTEQVKAVCEKELKFLEELPQAAVTVTAEPAVPAKEIEEKILDTFRQDASAAEAFAPQSAEPPAQAEQPSAAPQSAPSYADPFVPAAEEPTRKIELDELKFGRNYNRPE